MQSKANWLDRVITYFNPKAGAERARFRLAESYFSTAKKRAYDGASMGRRTEGWITTASSANTEVRYALHRLRERARDLGRNEPYAKRGLRIIRTNTVGAGIIPVPIGSSKGRSKKFQDLWRAWGETNQCDFDGRHNFYGLQALVMRTVAESGECLIRRHRLGKVDERNPVPVRIQVLEPDYLDSLKEEILYDNDKKNKTGFIIQGIEYDAKGKRVAYWLYPEHPGGFVLGRLQGLRPERVPAEEVLHIYEMERPGQVRGVTWFSPVIVKFKDFSDFGDATLLRQKIASLFAAFVTDEENSSDFSGGTKEPPLGKRLEAGAIEELSGGKKVAFSDPPSPIGYAEFSREQLRALAGGLGVTYEALTGDYSQVNFSSARMGRIEFYANVDDWRWNMLIPQFCEPAWSWFTEAAGIAGYGTQSVYSKWTPPRRELVDPAREIPAMIKASRAGFQSLSQTIRENGYDPEEVFEEIARDNEAIDRLKLILDSDPRKTQQAGTIQSDRGSDGEKDANAA